MKAKFLFPARFRFVGLFLAFTGLTLGYFVLYEGYQITGFGFGPPRAGIDALTRPQMNFTDELAITLSIVGLLFIGFARWKTEDELTARVRLDALHWAALTHTLLILVAFIINNTIIQPIAGSQLFGTWTILSDADWLIYTLLSPLIIFIARLWYLRSRFEKGKIIRLDLLKLPEKPFRSAGIIGGFICIVILILALAEDRIPWLSDYINETTITWVWYLFPVFLLSWIFSGSRKEDEYDEQKRLESWQLALYINYLSILLLTYTVYGLNYLAILFVFVPYLLPVLFILTYNIRKFRTATLKTDEKYH